MPGDLNDKAPGPEKVLARSSGVGSSLPPEPSASLGSFPTLSLHPALARDDRGDWGHGDLKAPRGEAPVQSFRDRRISSSPGRQQLLLQFVFQLPTLVTSP